MSARIIRITIPTSHPKPFDSESLSLVSTHEPRQQYSGLMLFVNVAVPLQSVSDGQTVPDNSSQVSFLIWKLSVGVPCGRTNILRGISKISSVSFCVNVMFIVPWKWPGTLGFRVRVRFCIPLGSMSSSSSALMKSTLEVSCKLVILLSPKLKSSIIPWVDVSVNVSEKNSSGFCLNSDFIIGDLNVAFSARYIIGIENSL